MMRRCTLRNTDRAWEYPATFLSVESNNETLFVWYRCPLFTQRVWYVYGNKQYVNSSRGMVQQGQYDFGEKPQTPGICHHTWNAHERVCSQTHASQPPVVFTNTAVYTSRLSFQYENPLWRRFLFSKAPTLSYETIQLCEKLRIYHVVYIYTPHIVYIQFVSVYSVLLFLFFVCHLTIAQLGRIHSNSKFTHILLMMVGAYLYR